LGRKGHSLSLRGREKLEKLGAGNTFLGAETDLGTDISGDHYSNLGNTGKIKKEGREGSAPLRREVGSAAFSAVGLACPFMTQRREVN